MTAVGWNRTALTNEAVVGAAMLLGLIAYGTVQYPASVSDGRGAILMPAVGLVVAYGAAALWNRRHRSGAAGTALMIGAAVGLLIGAIDIVNILLEYSGSVSAVVHGVAPPVAMGLMAMLFGACGSMAYQRTGSVGLGVWGAIWCAVIATLLTCLFGFVYNVEFMPYMEQIGRDQYARSGMHDPSAFVIRTTLEDISSHLAIAPLMAVFFGCLAALMTAQLRRARRSVVTIWAASCAVLLAVGIAAIRWALLLVRSQRPPFIMFGMIASGIALAYTYPVFSALVRASTESTIASEDEHLGEA